MKLTTTLIVFINDYHIEYNSTQWDSVNIRKGYIYVMDERGYIYDPKIGNRVIPPKDLYVEIDKCTWDKLLAEPVPNRGHIVDKMLALRQNCTHLSKEHCEQVADIFDI